MAYHWDSAQFALALTDYNPTRSQPQAPGYFLYIVLGRLVNAFVHDPHASLVWISVVAGAALAATGYLLGTAMFGTGCGWATAVILATSPLCWFQSEVALTYIVDGELVAATVLACWLTVRDRGGWEHVVALSVLMALVAGIRQQSAPILLPVWLFAFSGMARPRWPKFVVGAALAALLCVAWFVPMVQLSGGMSSYWTSLEAKARFDAPLTAWHGGFAALWKNVDRLTGVCWAGAFAPATVATLLQVRWTLASRYPGRQRFYHDHRHQLCLLVLWIVPMVAFWLCMYVVTTGYVLSFFPGLAVAAGVVIGHVKKRTALVPLLAFIGAVNCGAFSSPARWPTRFMLGLPLTAAELREHDRQLAEKIALVRREFDPKNVVICHGCEHYYWGFRQYQYHLPEYENLLLYRDASVAGTAASKFWLSQSGRTSFVDQIPLRSDQTALLVVPPGESLGMFAPFFDIRRAHAVDGAAGWLYEISREDLRR
jgi:hypothetical protein